MQPVHRVAVETMVVGLAWFVLLSGCAAREPLPPEEPPATRNIASQVLPGQWQVVDESVVFTFDDQGIPLSIRNDADPQDSRTNVVFGEPATIAAPIGRIDIVFLPTEPSIDEQTGEARFAATASGSRIVFIGLPIPGTAHATYEFSGQYDATTGDLAGQSDVKVYYGSLLIYSGIDEYVLRKIQ